MEWRNPRRPVLMPAGFIEPCQPTVTKKAPSGSNWIHEIKHDGYRPVARKDRGRVRMFTRGFEWTDRYPAIRVALKMLRVQSATIDGEAVYCGSDGISDFDTLHSHAHNHEVFLYAFDLLELNGEDLRLVLAFGATHVLNLRTAHSGEPEPRRVVTRPPHSQLSASVLVRRYR